jgi:SAM-dependent methyltransferase
VEPSGPLAAAARAEGLDVREGVLPQASLDGVTFDIVTLVDVIEHVDDPLALLRQCRAQLEPGARILVVTPDRSSVAARVLRDRWWHRRIAHVSYFDRATLTDALRRTGFEPQRWTHPRWYLPAGYLFTRALQYVPVLRDRAGRGDGGGRVIVPFNLFDSLAVVARAS